MKRLCVYCGSSMGVRDEYAAAARELAAQLTGKQIGLVYGGASKGIMGIIANAMLQAGGSVTGVIPRALGDREVAHPDLTELHIVDSMHERKSLMAMLADGFVALPGGFGTLEEIVEVLTWGQLQFHAKPCGLLNVGGYFDLLLAWCDHATAEGFIRAEHREMLIVEDTVEELLASFEQYVAPTIEKWAE